MGSKPVFALLVFGQAYSESFVPAAILEAILFLRSELGIRYSSPLKPLNLNGTKGRLPIFTCLWIRVIVPESSIIARISMVILKEVSLFERS